MVGTGQLAVLIGGGMIFGFLYTAIMLSIAIYNRLSDTAEDASNLMTNEQQGSSFD